MWIADHWKDYEVIDCSDGEKLERWGDYILGAPRSPGHLEHPQNAKGLEANEWAITTAAQRAVANGSFSISPNSGRFTMGI